MEENAVICPQEGKQDMMVNIDVDFIIAGGSVGSSKSYSALMRSLRYLDCPNYRGGYFRRNYKDLEGPGGLVAEATKIYTKPCFGGVWKDKKGKFVFPNGAEISFHHLDDENKVEQMYSGLQFTAIFIDEVQYFSEESVMFLHQRLRSDSKYDSFMFLTCNPEPPPHWLHKWVDWYLIKEDEIEDTENLFKAGRANQDKAGVVRYYIMKDGTPVFSEDPEELKRNYPDMFQVENLRTGEIEEVEPSSFTFIGATLFDNEILMKMRPEYLRTLNSKPFIEKERKLFGNWYVQPEGANFFDRNWLTEVECLPDTPLVHCRAWDKAYVAPSDKNKNPDYTACSPLFSKSRDGTIYVSWGVHPDIKDNSTDTITGQFKKQPGERDALILKQALHDGPHVTVVLARDGAAGVQDYQQSAKQLASHGIIVKQDPMVHTMGKMAKFSAFSSAAQNGVIKIVKSSFPNQQTYEAYMKHLETFHGQKSRGNYHDDWADATASAYNHICEQTYIPNFVLPNNGFSQATRYRTVMNTSIPTFGSGLSNKGGYIA